MRTFIEARHETLSALPIKPGLNDRSQAYLQAKCEPFRYSQIKKKVTSRRMELYKKFVFFFKLKR